MEPKKSIFKYALGIILGVLALAGVCSIGGCGGGGGSSSGAVSSTTPAPDMSGLPPDPGPNGKLTLAGVDADADGVRDDIQRYTAINHPNSAKARAALTQYVKAVQAALIDANDKVKSIQHAEEINRAIDCEAYIAGSVDGATAMEGDVQSLLLNTSERNKAYFTWNDQLGGEVFRGTPYNQRASTCTFDVSTLPN